MVSLQIAPTTVDRQKDKTVRRIHRYATLRVKITARIYAIAQQVRKIETDLEVERMGEIVLIPITFNPNMEEYGIAALYFANDFYQASKSRKVRFIRPRTQTILDLLKIPYNVVSPEI